MAGAMVGLIVFAVYSFWFVTLTIDFEPAPFDSAVWKSTEPEFSWESMRLRMVDDLLARHELVGQTRDQIVELIGKPDDTGWFHDDEMVYYLGLERNGFIAIDSEWLVIDLDEEGVAVEAFLARD